MRNELNKIYTDFFHEIDQKISAKFGKLEVELKIIGYTALVMSGLADRGTKDVDALKVGVFDDVKNKSLVDYINSEFGMKSSLDIKFGIYLDLVSKSIPWLPLNPVYHNFKRFGVVRVSYLDSVDVCVSKLFSHFKNQNRFNDLKDIKMCLDVEIVDIKNLVQRVDETFSKYEMHSEASLVFPKVIDYLKNELIGDYSIDAISLKYSIPNWMQNA